MFEVTPELVDYLAEVACLEKPYAKHVLKAVFRMVDEAVQPRVEPTGGDVPPLVDPVVEALRNLGDAIAPPNH